MKLLQLAMKNKGAVLSAALVALVAPAVVLADRQGGDGEVVIISDEIRGNSTEVERPSGEGTETSGPAAKSKKKASKAKSPKAKRPKVKKAKKSKSPKRKARKSKKSKSKKSKKKAPTPPSPPTPPTPPSPEGYPDI